MRQKAPGSSDNRGKYTRIRSGVEPKPRRGRASSVDDCEYAQNDGAAQNSAKGADASEFQERSSIIDNAVHQVRAQRHDRDCDRDNVDSSAALFEVTFSAPYE